MSPARRALACALVVLGIFGASAGSAFAHATLIGASPDVKSHVKTTPTSVLVRFSEGVQVVNRTDVTVVDSRGTRVDAARPHTLPGDSSAVVIPLKGTLLPDSYTVRVRVVSSDSHATDQVFVFGVGTAPLKPPVLTGTGGLSDNSASVVVARAVELVALGLLLGLIAFRLLAWGPAAAGGVDGDDRDRALRHGQRLFWRAFWPLVVLAGIAETTILAAKSAVVFHTSLATAFVHPGDAYRLVSASRFGDLFGWRGAALAALVAVAFVTWTAESARQSPAARRGPLGLMAGLGVVALTMLSTQGHASQAPLAPLSVLADAAHLTAAAIWVAGLPCLAVVLLRAPRLLPGGAGRRIASATMSRFSRIALWSVAIISVTGLARMAGELSSVSQLWGTEYGRSLIMKATLLAPIMVLAVRHRRMVAAMGEGWTPSAARLRAVARTVQMELALAVGIIGVAAVLVAQVPGRV
jgi:copper transport protein